MYDNYPPGAANDPRAPYNQVDAPEIAVDVEVTVTMHKWVRVYVTDYEYSSDVEYDDEGGKTFLEDYDVRGCDFKKAVEEQVVLPNELADVLEEKKVDLGSSPYLKQAVEDCKGWEIDEILTEDWEKA